jgi:tetratricopeptide (TPR) repeat protein
MTIMTRTNTTARPASLRQGGKLALPIRTRRMRSLLRPLLALLVVATFAGCDFLDPTEVTNPTVTQDDFINLPNAATTWTHGVERQLAIAVNDLVLYGEVGSDNLFNNRTLFTRTFDIPEMEPVDAAVVSMQREVQRLRAMADDGLNRVVPADAGATDETRARLHYHRAYAHLAAGEYFVGLPAEGNGPVMGPEAHLEAAIQDFGEARGLSSDPTLQSAATLGIARAHHRMGNVDEAVAAAEQVRANDPLLLRSVEYDISDGPTNTMQTAIYDSGQDEFQPLPRMDFLFPKYFSVSATDQSPIAIAKGEEAFLILAEAALARNDLQGARDLLVELLDVVDQRPTAMVNDDSQQRGRAGGTWIYPNRSEVLVAASPDDEPLPGLVLDRQDGPVEVPRVSGTSVTAERIAGAQGEEALLELLYLMRQEIFVVEGRRIVDLGIRLPVALEEAEANENIALDAEVLRPFIPAWIPGDRGMNRFDYEDGDGVAVIHHNLNRALVQNRTSDAILPFH